MISKEEIRRIKEVIAPYNMPMLSVYVNVDPSEPENGNKAYLIRAKNALKDLDVPDKLSKKIFDSLEYKTPQLKTRAIFVSQDIFESFDFQVDLPIIDLRHGNIEAYFGEPYVTPLTLAIDEYERYGVTLLSKERWRFFEVYMGEIIEVQDVFLAINMVDWRKVSEARPASTIGIAGRGGTGRDKFDRRLLMWVSRFYKNAANLLEKTVQDRNIDRLLIMGPSEDTAYFESFVSKSIQKKIMAHTSSLPNMDASSREVLYNIKGTIIEIEYQQEMALLNQVREKGLWGFEVSLIALQEGRFHLLAISWRPDNKVYVCKKTNLVFSNFELAKKSCEGGIVNVELKDVVVDLAAMHGTRLKFLQGTPQKRLLSEFGGMAGLTRW